MKKLAILVLAGALALSLAAVAGAHRVTIRGTDGPDTISGTPGADVIVAKKGNGTVAAGGGDS